MLALRYRLTFIDVEMEHQGGAEKRSKLLECKKMFPAIFCVSQLGFWSDPYITDLGIFSARFRQFLRNVPRKKGKQVKPTYPFPAGKLGVSTSWGLVHLCLVWCLRAVTFGKMKLDAMCMSRTWQTARRTAVFFSILLWKKMLGTKWYDYFMLHTSVNWETTRVTTNVSSLKDLYP